MHIATLFEKVKAALKSLVCLYCAQKLSANSAQFCLQCQDVLSLKQPQALVDQPGFVCHAASHFSPTIKKLIYGYKFYAQTQHEEKLAGLLIHYWESLLAQSQMSVTHPENVLVVPVPPHRAHNSHVEGFARRFARSFGYDFRPGTLYWQRRIEPQHTLPEKQARFRNIANSLQVSQKGLRGHDLIVVIDDLTTTGATLQEANRALRASFAHPEQMELVTLAVAKVPLGFYRQQQ